MQDTGCRVQGILAAAKRLGQLEALASLVTGLRSRPAARGVILDTFHSHSPALAQIINRHSKVRGEG